MAVQRAGPYSVLKDEKRRRMLDERLLISGR